MLGKHFIMPLKLKEQKWAGFRLSVRQNAISLSVCIYLEKNVFMKASFKGCTYISRVIEIIFKEKVNYCNNFFKPAL